jgi:hypothetical protein
VQSHTSLQSKDATRTHPQFNFDAQARVCDTTRLAAVQTTARHARAAVLWHASGDKVLRDELAQRQGRPSWKNGPSATWGVRHLGACKGQMAKDDMSVLARSALASLEEWAKRYGEEASPAGGSLQAVRCERSCYGWPGVEVGSLIDQVVRRLLPIATLGVTGIGGVTDKTLRKCRLCPV